MILICNGIGRQTYIRPRPHKVPIPQKVPMDHLQTGTIGGRDHLWSGPFVVSGPYVDLPYWTASKVGVDRLTGPHHPLVGRCLQPP